MGMREVDGMMKTQPSEIVPISPFLDKYRTEFGGKNSTVT